MNIDVAATNDNIPFLNALGAEEIGRFSNKQKKDNKLKIISALQPRLHNRSNDELNDISDIQQQIGLPSNFEISH